jgi:hypothetical protein
LKGIVLSTAAILASAVCASAQALDKISAAPSAVEGQEPARPAPQPAAAQGSQLTPARLERIYHIRQIEGMLTNAVKAGANTFAYQVQAEPNSLFISNARARGFELEGYGVFFDVDVPTIVPSVLWASQVMQQNMQDVYELRDTINNPKTDPRVRRIAEMELRRLERQLGLQPPAQVNAASNVQAAPQGMALAASTDVSAVAIPAVPPSPARPDVSAVTPLPDARDPDEIYTEAIKAKLIDAMLSYGSALRIADNEWLTVAARASKQGLPGTLDDSSSIVLRIKGTDLTSFLTGKITRDEAIKRVEIKES